MKEKRRIVWILLIFLGLTACGGSAGSVVEVTRVVTQTEVVEGEAVEVTRVVVVEAEAEPAPGAVAGLQPTAVATSAAPGTQPQQRLIIKDGNMIITVADTETAVSAATDLAVGLGGYVISQDMSDNAQGYKFATMRVAVPVDQFEFAMRELRKLGQVTDESSSGEDVTDEYTDFNARLTNLQATRDRLLEFLDEAQNIDEILEVNEELTSVEEEIAVIQGRINFLRDRAAFSTISLTLNPLLPTPTPTPSPTPTKVPTPESWRPGDTADTALVELQNTAQNAADFTIYNTIVCGPWLLLLLLIGFPILLVWRSRLRRARLLQLATEVAPVESTPDTGGGDDVA